MSLNISQRTIDNLDLPEPFSRLWVLKQEQKTRERLTAHPFLCLPIHH